MQTFGTYNVKIPTHDGRSASLKGIALDAITRTFPQYPLTNAFKDIADHFKSNRGDPEQLPKPPQSVGGDIHFMIGIKYIKHHPKLIYQLPSGLSIYESIFANPDGSRGVIGGPHSVFTQIHNVFFNQSSRYLGFLSDQYKLFMMGIQVNPDVKLLSSHQEDIDDNKIDSESNALTSFTADSTTVITNVSPNITTLSPDQHSISNEIEPTQSEANHIQSNNDIKKHLKHRISKPTATRFVTSLKITPRAFINRSLRQTYSSKRKLSKTFVSLRSNISITKSGIHPIVCFNALKRYSFFTRYYACLAFWWISVKSRSYGLNELFKMHQFVTRIFKFIFILFNHWL